MDNENIVGETNIIVDQPIYPHPAKIVKFEVDAKTSGGPPGEFEFSPTGKLLKSVIDYDGVAKDLIEDYNNLIEIRIKHTFTNTRIPIIHKAIDSFLTENKLKTDEYREVDGAENKNTIRKVYLVIEDVKYELPKKDNKPLYPFQVRNTYDSYMANIKLKIAIDIVDIVNGVATTIRKRYNTMDGSDGYILMGQLPIMTGSVLDNLVYITPKSRWINFGEDPRDPMAQFIIGGNNYTLFLKDGMRQNRIFNYEIGSGNNPLGMISILTSSSPHFTRRVRLAKTKFGEVYILLRSTKEIASTKVKESGYPDNLNIFTFIRFMFNIDQMEIMKLILLFVKKPHTRKILNYLLITQEKDNSIPDAFEHIAGLMGDVINTNNISKNEFLKTKYYNIFNTDFFPHIDDQKYSEQEKLGHKKLLIIYMLVRYLEYVNLLREADDRDSWYNKAIINASVSVHQQINSVWNNIVSNLEEVLRESNKKWDPNAKPLNHPDNEKFYRDIFTVTSKKLNEYVYQSNYSIGGRFEHCFKNNTWGPQRNYQQRDDGKSEMIQQGESIISKYSLVTKINNPSSDKHSSMAIRGIKRTGIGIEDIVETPESVKCGLRTNKAVTCWVSVERDVDKIRNDIINSTFYRANTSRSSNYDVCMVNGIVIGWCIAREIVSMVKYNKRMGLYEKDISAIYDPDDRCLYVHTDRSRPTRPLLVVENNELLIDKLGMWGETDFSKLLKAGVVEYIDQWDTQYGTVAYSVDLIRKFRIENQGVKDELEFLIQRYDMISDTPYESSDVKLETYIDRIKDLEENIIKINKSTAMDWQNVTILENNIKKIQDAYNIRLKKYQSTTDIGDKANSLEAIISLVKSLVNLYRKKNNKAEIDIKTLLGAKQYYISYINILTSQIQIIKNKINEKELKKAQNITNIERYGRYTPDNIQFLIKNILLDFNDKIIEKLKHIKIGFSKDIRDDGLLNILKNNLSDLVDPKKLLETVIPYETEITIDSGSLNLKHKYYIELIELIKNSFNTIDFIRKENDEKRFILAKRYLNKNRLILLANLGTLGGILDNLEELLETEREKINKKLEFSSDQYEIKSKMSLTQRKEELKTLRVRIKITKESYENIVNTQFSYCELDPNAMLGINSSLIPYWNHNDNVRNAYAATQSKQALSGISLVDLFRFSATAKRLAVAERPIAEPQANRMFGLDKTPYGQMVTLAIMDIGWNREDSIFLRKKSVDNGLFRMVIFKTHSLTKEKQKSEGNNVTYHFGIPKGSKPNQTTSNIIEDGPNAGLPKVGSYIGRRDVIIGMYSIIRDSKGDIVNYTDHSLRAVVGQDGIVDRVLKSTNVKGEEVANVRIRKIRNPQIGDKFATRSAQKSVISGFGKDTDMSTIGGILSDDEMPRSEELGYIPDVIMNTLAVPSRMTINQKIEMFMSLFAVLRGQQEDATGFQNIKERRVQRMFQKYGINPSGKTKFVFGKSGAKIYGDIFYGPVYYLTLSHNVEDKIQFRDRGNTDPMTRRPVGGKSMGGGNKLGEMEHHALISHGAFKVIQERSCISGGGHTAVWCRKCGIMAGITNEDIKTGESVFKCRGCKTRDKKDLGVCSVPYVFKNFSDTLAGMNIKVGIQFKP